MPPRRASQRAPSQVNPRMAQYKRVDPQTVSSSSAGKRPAAESPDHTVLSKRPRTSSGRELAAPWEPNFGAYPIRRDQSAFNDAGVALELARNMILPVDAAVAADKSIQALNVEGIHDTLSGLVKFVSFSERTNDALSAAERELAELKQKYADLTQKYADLEIRHSVEKTEHDFWLRKAGEHSQLAKDFKTRASNAEAQLKGAEDRIKNETLDELFKMQNSICQVGYDMAALDFGIAPEDPRRRSVTLPDDFYLEYDEKGGNQQS